MRSVSLNTVLLIVMIILTACSHSIDTFDCPRQAGVSCQRIDEVNLLYRDRINN